MGVEEQNENSRAEKTEGLAECGLSVPITKP